MEEEEAEALIKRQLACRRLLASINKPTRAASNGALNSTSD